jgi:hypothetical protein
MMSPLTVSSVMVRDHARPPPVPGHEQLLMVSLGLLVPLQRLASEGTIRWDSIILINGQFTVVLHSRDSRGWS